MCDKIPEACPLQTPFFNYSRVYFVHRFDRQRKMGPKLPHEIAKFCPVDFESFDLQSKCL